MPEPNTYLDLFQTWLDEYTTQQDADSWNEFEQQLIDDYGYLPGSETDEYDGPPTSIWDTFRGSRGPAPIYVSPSGETSIDHAIGVYSDLESTMPPEIRALFERALAKGVEDGISNLSLSDGLTGALAVLVKEVFVIGQPPVSPPAISPDDLAALEHAINVIAAKISPLVNATLRNGALLRHVLYKQAALEELFYDNADFQQRLTNAVNFLVSEADAQLLQSVPGGGSVFDDVIALYNQLGQAIIEGAPQHVIDARRAAFREKVHEVKSTHQQYYEAISNIQSAGTILGVALHLFGAPAAAQRLGSMINGVLSITAGIAALSGQIPLAAGLGPLAPYAALACGLFSIFGAFGTGGDSPDQQLMDAIVTVSKQIEQLRDEMHDRFDVIQNILETGFSNLLQLSISQAHLLSEISGDLQTMQSALVNAGVNFRSQMNQINQVIIELFQDRFSYDLVTQQNLAFGFLHNTLASPEVASASDVITLPEWRLAGLEDGYLHLRSAALESAHPFCHADIPSFNTAFMALASSSCSDDPLTDAASLHSAFNANGLSFKTEALIEVMHAFSVLPPTGLPRVPNLQVFVETTKPFLQWSREAASVWRPANLVDERAHLHTLTSHGIHLLAVGTLCRLNFNLFSILAHQSKRARDHLLNAAEGRFSTNMAEPSHSEQLRDVYRSNITLGPQILSTKLFPLFPVSSDPEHPFYEYLHSTVYRTYNTAAPTLGPLGLWQWISPRQYPEVSEDELKTLILDNIEWSSELLRDALRFDVSFDWKAPLTSALHRVLQIYNYSAFTDAAVYSDDILRGKVHSTVRNSTIDDFFDLPSVDSPFAEEMRRNIIEHSAIAAFTFLDNIPQEIADQNGWIDEVRLWWTLIEDFVNLGFPESGWIATARTRAEYEAQKPFVELRWKDLIIANYRTTVDTWAPHHAFEWESPECDNDFARLCALACLTCAPGGIQTIMKMCKGQYYCDFWDVISETIMDMRAATIERGIALNTPRELQSVVWELVEFIRKFHAEDYFEFASQYADNRIRDAFEFVFGQEIIGMPEERVGNVHVEEWQPSWIDYIDRVVDERVIDIIRGENLPLSDRGGGIVVAHGSNNGSGPLFEVTMERDSSRPMGPARGFDPVSITRRGIGVLNLSTGYDINRRKTRAIKQHDWRSLRMAIAEELFLLRGESDDKRAACIMFACQNLPHIRDLSLVLESIDDAKELLMVPCLIGKNGGNEERRCPRDVILERWGLLGIQKFGLETENNLEKN